MRPSLRWRKQRRLPSWNFATAWYRPTFESAPSTILRTNRSPAKRKTISMRRDEKPLCELSWLCIHWWHILWTERDCLPRYLRIDRQYSDGYPLSYEQEVKNTRRPPAFQDFPRIRNFETWVLSINRHNHNFIRFLYENWPDFLGGLDFLIHSLYEPATIIIERLATLARPSRLLIAN